MKKSSKLLLTLSLMGLGFTTLASCSSPLTNPFTGEGFIIEGGEGSGETEVTTYKIINASSDCAYLDGLPEKGEAGKSYSFRVSLKPGYHFNDKVTITYGETTVAVSQEGDTYTFVMPEADISISVDVGQTDFTITNDCYFVKGVFLDDEEGTTEVKSAVAGTLLKFEAVADVDFSFTEVTINGKAIEEDEDGYYHFSMPARPVIISSDKNAIAYDVSLKTELTLSTVAIYKDAETKEAITSAIKGDKIYVELSSEIEHISYSISAKTAGEDGKDVKVEKEGETGNLFSFTMVSDDIEVSIIEKDMTLFYTTTVTNKAWKGIEVYGSSKDGVHEYAYGVKDQLTAEQSFSVDGTMTTNENPATWEPTSASHANCIYTYRSSWSGDKELPFEAVWTDNILAVQWRNVNSTTAVSAWNDSYFCLADDTYTLHTYAFNDYYRFAWIQDADGNIIENILIKETETYINLTVKKEDGTVAVGSDIVAGASLGFYEGEREIMKVASDKAVITSAITTVLDEHVECAILDADGNEVTTGINGKKITIQPRLAEGTPERYALKAPVVKDANGKVISTTKVTNGDDLDYTFTMPTTAVTITVDTKDAEKFAGYAALGDYKVYNIYNSNSGDKDFSDDTTYDASIQKDGTFDLRGTAYEILSMDNASVGVAKVENSSHEEGNVYFGDNLLLTAFRPYESTYQDAYLGVKVPEGHELSEITNQVHYKNAGTLSCWAASYFCGEDLIGSVFVYNGKEVYMGVTFTFDEGSTRVSSTSSYHVVKDGVTLFDVSNDTFTKVGQ